MGFDQRALAVVEAAGLVENGEWNFGLADVVEHRGRIEPLDVGLGETETQSKVYGYSRNQKAVLKGAFMVAADRREPVGQAILGDTFGNLAADALGARDIDGRT